MSSERKLKSSRKAFEEIREGIREWSDSRIFFGGFEFERKKKNQSDKRDPHSKFHIFYCHESKNTKCNMKIRVYITQTEGGVEKRYCVTRGNHDHSPKSVNRSVKLGKRKRRKIDMLQSCQKSELVQVVPESGRVEGNEKVMIFFSLSEPQYYSQLSETEGESQIKGPFFGDKTSPKVGKISQVDGSCDLYDIQMNHQKHFEACKDAQFVLTAFTPENDPGLVNVWMNIIGKELMKESGFLFVDNSGKNRMMEFDVFADLNDMQEEEEPDYRSFEDFLSGDYNNNDGFSFPQEDETNPFGSNFLHFAAARGRLDLIRHLVENAGYDSYPRDCVGLTPLHVSRFFQHHEVSQYFQESEFYKYSCVVGEQEKLEKLVDATKHVRLPTVGGDLSHLAMTRYFEFSEQSGEIGVYEFLEREMDVITSTKTSKFYFDQKRNSWVLKNEKNGDFYQQRVSREIQKYRVTCKVKLRLMKPFDKFTNDDQADVIRCFSNLVDIEDEGNVSVVKTESGSTIITLLLYSFSTNKITKMVRRINDPDDVVEFEIGGQKIVCTTASFIPNNLRNDDDDENNNDIDPEKSEVFIYHEADPDFLDGEEIRSSIERFQEEWNDVRSKIEDDIAKLGLEYRIEDLCVLDVEGISREFVEKFSSLEVMYYVGLTKEGDVKLSHDPKSGVEGGETRLDDDTVIVVYVSNEEENEGEGEGEDEDTLIITRNPKNVLTRFSFQLIPTDQRLMELSTHLGCLILGSGEKDDPRLVGCFTSGQDRFMRFVVGNEETGMKLYLLFSGIESHSGFGNVRLFKELSITEIDTLEDVRGRPYTGGGRGLTFSNIWSSVHSFTVGDSFGNTFDYEITVVGRKNIPKQMCLFEPEFAIPEPQEMVIIIEEIVPELSGTLGGTYEYRVDYKEYFYRCLYLSGGETSEVREMKVKGVESREHDIQRTARTFEEDKFMSLAEDDVSLFVVLDGRQIQLGEGTFVRSFFEMAQVELSRMNFESSKDCLEFYMSIGNENYRIKRFYYSKEVINKLINSDHQVKTDPGRIELSKMWQQEKRGEEYNEFTSETFVGRITNGGGQIDFGRRRFRGSRQLHFPESDILVVSTVWRRRDIARALSEDFVVSTKNFRKLYTTKYSGLETLLLHKLNERSYISVDHRGKFLKNYLFGCSEELLDLKGEDKISGIGEFRCDFVVGLSNDEFCLSVKSSDETAEEEKFCLLFATVRQKCVFGRIPLSSKSLVTKSLLRKDVIYFTDRIVNTHNHQFVVKVYNWKEGQIVGDCMKIFGCGAEDGEVGYMTFIDCQHLEVVICGEKEYLIFLIVETALNFYNSFDDFDDGVRVDKSFIRCGILNVDTEEITIFEFPNFLNHLGSALTIENEVLRGIFSVYDSVVVYETPLSFEDGVLKEDGACNKWSCFEIARLKNKIGRLAVVPTRGNGDQKKKYLLLIEPKAEDASFVAEISVFVTKNDVDSVNRCKTLVQNINKYEDFQDSVVISLQNKRIGIFRLFLE